MGAGLAGDPPYHSAVHSDGIEVTLAGSVPRGAEVDLALLLIHGFYLVDLPLTRREDSEQVARGGSDLEMAKAAALGAPQPLAVGECPEVAMEIDVLGRTF